MGFQYVLHWYPWPSVGDAGNFEWFELEFLQWHYHCCQFFHCAQIISVKCNFQKSPYEMIAWIRIWKTIRQHSVIKIFIAHIQQCVHSVWERPDMFKIFFHETDTYSLDKWKRVFLEAIEITISHNIFTKKTGPSIPLVDRSHHAYFWCNSVSITLCRCSLAHWIFCLFTWAIQTNTGLITEPYALEYCWILLRNVLGKSP